MSSNSSFATDAADRLGLKREVNRSELLNLLVSRLICNLPLTTLKKISSSLRSDSSSKRLASAGGSEFGWLHVVWSEAGTATSNAASRQAIVRRVGYEKFGGRILIDSWQTGPKCFSILRLLRQMKTAARIGGRLCGIRWRGFQLIDRQRCGCRLRVSGSIEDGHHKRVEAAVLIVTLFCCRQTKRERIRSV